ncbi:hypothetical protein JYU34_022079 [Plutella xylostella]|uniref:Ceramide phosphoethanolamine synthase n=1 Tax=Plutella xylostella TaxID=51655 RepID=A0ABQ7PQ70_PLUXY|nr:hypothetical protein JYU34_022079 [Plutella xylostella]
MMWPSSQASKILLALLIFVIVYCVIMDTLLFMRMRRFKLHIFDVSPDNTTSNLSTLSPIEPDYEEVTWTPCTINPLCHPTVKALMIDSTNHYIYGPLCAIFDISTGLSENMLFITPNMISIFHVFIALIAGKLFTFQSLAARRVAVVLYQIRTILDDLDGHVARERKHIKGERSEVGTLGYWVDGFCDMIGVVAMIVGITFYLKNNPPRKGYRGASVSTLPYHQLKEMNTLEDMDKDGSEVGISYKTKVSFPKIAQVVCWFSGQLLLSSLMWNRYVDVYQELLENCVNFDVMKRQEVFRSSIFFTATSFWRLLNPHSYLHLLCLAVFCDKTWIFLKMVHHSGYVCLLFAVAISEYFIAQFRLFVSSGADCCL